MKKAIVFGVMLALLIPWSSISAAKANPDCKALEQIFKTNVESKGSVCTLEIIRTSLNVTHMGEKLSPETMELVFHFSFEKVGADTIVMGEMALLQDEVNPVADQLRKGGLEVTAIHNHMIHEKPRIMYLHVQGKGDIIRQANALINAIAATKEQKKDE